jgi:hypothetical protein
MTSREELEVGTSNGGSDCAWDEPAANLLRASDGGSTSLLPSMLDGCPASKTWSWDKAVGIWGMSRLSLLLDSRHLIEHIMISSIT